MTLIPHRHRRRIRRGALAITFSVAAVAISNPAASSTAPAEADTAVDLGAVSAWAEANGLSGLSPAGAAPVQVGK